MSDVLSEHIHKIHDTRQSAKTVYHLHDCYMSGFAMFFLQDPSLLEFQRRFQNSIQRNNLSRVFGARDIPGDSQLREVIDEHSYESLYGVFEEYFQWLQRGKHQILQVTLVGVGKREVIPFGPEFVCNRDVEGAQGNELKAGKRLIPKLRAAHTVSFPW